MLKKYVASAALAGSLVGLPLHAQEPAGSSKPVVTPLKVTVTISRFQGEKRISSLPYTISIGLDTMDRGGVVGSGTGSRRIGTKVPISTSSTPQGGGAPVAKVEYQDVGTSIDCRAFGADQFGRYRLDITIEETSVYDDPAAKGVVQIGRPTFRSFRTSEALMLRNGQSAELSSTPDRLTGEIVKVEVSLEVIK